MIRKQIVNKWQDDGGGKRKNMFNRCLFMKTVVTLVLQAERDKRDT